MKLIDINTWNRKEHFEYFAKMQSPFLGVTANVKCTSAYQLAKLNKWSFFALYLHQSMKVVNDIQAFKLRIIEDKIYELPQINAGATISRKDNTFAFIYTEYHKDFQTFCDNLNKEIEEVHHSTGLRLNDDDVKVDLIRHTTLPWVSFTSILHPTNFNTKDSVPKISFGGLFEQNGEMYLPISVEAHHGLVDGYHISHYFKELEKNLSNL